MWRFFKCIWCILRAKLGYAHVYTIRINGVFIRNMLCNAHKWSLCIQYFSQSTCMEFLCIPMRIILVFVRKFVHKHSPLDSTRRIIIITNQVTHGVTGLIRNLNFLLLIINFVDYGGTWSNRDSCSWYRCKIWSFSWSKSAFGRHSLKIHETVSSVGKNGSEKIGDD